MVPVALISTEFGVITILRSRSNGSHIYAQDDGWQSHADRTGVSLSYYIHALYGLATQTGAREVLMIGGGGGTLGTMLTNAGLNVTIVDINPTSFTIARDFFSLSPAIECHVCDGADFLGRQDRFYDLIIVDAFDGGAIPTHLRSVEFFLLAQRRLNAAGHILVNVLLDHDFDRTADDIAFSVAVTGLDVQVLDIQGDLDRNAIVVGSGTGPLKPPTLLVVPEIQQEQIAEALGNMRFRARRKSRSVKGMINHLARLIAPE